MRTETRDKDGKIVAVGEISSLPGCSQIAVFHAAFVLPQYRNHGYGYQAHCERIQKTQDLLYDYSLCTVEATNEYQIKNLQRAQWKPLDHFTSKRSGHTVYIYGKQI